MDRLQEKIVTNETSKTYKKHFGKDAILTYTLPADEQLSQSRPVAKGGICQRLRNHLVRRST
jgi:hypothetical protein